MVSDVQRWVARHRILVRERASTGSTVAASASERIPACPSPSSTSQRMHNYSSASRSSVAARALEADSRTGQYAPVSNAEGQSSGPTTEAVAAGWYADPWGIAVARWWNGGGWTSHVTGGTSPVASPRSVLDAAWTAIVLRWRAWIVIAHASAAPLIGLYLAIVGINNLVFDYSFWNEPPPSEAADTAAVVGLWCLGVVALPIVTLSYGWMAAHARDSTSLRGSLRHSFRVWLATGWYAVPLGLVALLSELFVAPAVLTAPFAALVALASLDGRPLAVFDRAVIRSLGGLAVVGCLAALLGVGFWMMFIATSLLAAWSPMAAWFLGWLWFVGTALGGGAIASGVVPFYKASAQSR